jgi:hypothetical protein
MTSQSFSDIVFSCHGKLYISSDLAQFPTDDERRPVIFMQPDFSGVFLLSINDIGVLDVAPLTARDLRTWLSRCSDPASANAIRKCLLNLDNSERRGRTRHRMAQHLRRMDIDAVGVHG